MKHSISVIVPAYNEEPSLEAAVSAIRRNLTEAGLEYEVVVVNDGSTDKTGEIAERLAYEHVDVEVVHHSDMRIDAIAIATPASTHFELAMQALQAGKPVFVRLARSATCYTKAVLK